MPETPTRSSIPHGHAATGMGERGDPVVERRTLRDYYVAIRERFWVALPLALLLSVGYGYWKSRETPLYASSSSLQFDKGETIVKTQGVTDPTVRSDADLNDYIQTLRSGTFRGRVLDSFTPDEVRILQRPFVKDQEPGTAAPAVSAVVPGWTITQPSAGRTVSINVTDRDPEAAALVADRVAAQFLDWMRLRQVSGGEDALERLKAESGRLETEQRDAESKLAQFSQDHDFTPPLDGAISLAVSRFSTAENELQAAHIAVQNLEIPINQVEQVQQNGQDLLQISAIYNVPEVASYQNELKTLEARQSVLAEKYLERHPEMIQIASQIDAARKKLQDAVNRAISSLRSDLAAAQEREQSAQQRRNAAQAELARLNGLKSEYNILQAQADGVRKSYNDSLVRLQEIATQQSTARIPVSISDHAVIPGRPYTPDLRSILRTSVGLGLLVFLGVAFSLSFLDDRIKSAWDVEHYVGANLLGIIPDLSALKDEEKYTLVLKNRQLPGVESFLSVYSAVKIHSKLDFPKSILVTSTIPGEGKTLISTNLAGSFARHGKKVLLIDGDLRRPTLHRRFQQPNDHGVIPWYEAGKKLAEDPTTDPDLGIIRIGDHLSLLCSGGQTRSPTEILESEPFGRLLGRLKHHFDLVLIDSPPLGAVTDSLLIAEQADEVIYVCRFNRASRKHIRLHVRSLRNGRNEILGVVLNGLTPRRIEYYSNYRYYRSYKKYYGAQS